MALTLTDPQWEKIRQYFPEENIPDWAIGTQTGGHPPCTGSGALDSQYGSRVHMLPQSYPNYKTVHRRFQRWCQQKAYDSDDLDEKLGEQGIK